MNPSRVVYKISGESLSHKGDGDSAFVSIDRFRFVVAELAALVGAGFQVIAVVGGGNFFRGSDPGPWTMSRIDADQIGIVATAMNALLLRSELNNHAMETRLLACGDVRAIGESWSRRAIEACLAGGGVIVVAGGVGQPLVSSDYASVFHAAKLEAGRVLVAKNGTDGVYDLDPNRFPEATKFAEITCSEILSANIQVMDFAAIDLARKARLQIDVFDAEEPGAAVKAMMGESPGSIIRPT